MDFQGACLPHCYAASPLTVNLARIAFVYIVASVGYLLMTRTLGTPFYDSLSEEQRLIKAASATARKLAFCKSIIVGLVILLVWKPFVKF